MVTALNDDTSISGLLQWARTRLQQLDSARLDAELLLSHVLSGSRSLLYAHPQRVPAPAQIDAFSALVERRATGEPVAYLIGECEFWSLALQVTPDTLIPRPETELLVEQALALLPDDQPRRVADLGTGSGAIAIAIAHERPAAQLLATDTSAAALNVARDNAARHQCDNITFQQSDWFTALGERRFDVIVSNPPYIAAADPALHSDGVRFEPRAALAAGDSGCTDLQNLIHGAGSHLQPGGWLLLEHGADQGATVTGLLRAAGFSETDCRPDTAGLPRVSRGRYGA